MTALKTQRDIVEFINAEINKGIGEFIKSSQGTDWVAVMDKTLKENTKLIEACRIYREALEVMAPDRRDGGSGGYYGQLAHDTLAAVDALNGKEDQNENK